MKKNFGRIDWKNRKTRIILALVLTPLFLVGLYIKPGMPRGKYAAHNFAAEATLPYYVWKAQHDGLHFDTISQEINAASLCWQYLSITAKGDGTTAFESKGNFIKTKGKAAGALSRQQLEQLSGLILASGYLFLPEHPPKDEKICATDTNIINTSVTIGGKKHSIRNACYINFDLQFFERKFLEIVDANQWLGSPQEQEKLETDCHTQFR